MVLNIIKPQSEIFSLEEAFKLMHCTVKPKENVNIKFTLDHVGVIQGVLDTEEEIEIVVRFIDGLKKFDKESFYKELELYVQGS